MQPGAKQGGDALELAIRDAFQTANESKLTAGTVPYSVVLLMGAEIVYPRACSTAEPEIQLEIDPKNQIFQLHEGPAGIERDLINTLPTEGEDALVQAEGYTHVLCPAKLGFELQLQARFDNLIFGLDLQLVDICESLVDERHLPNLLCFPGGLGLHVGDLQDK